MIRIITIGVAVLGLLVAIAVVATATQELPDPPPAQPPAVNPYPRGIAALGFVEPASRQVDVGAPEPGLVTRVFVRVGDAVHPGDSLFALDDRALRADLLTARAARDRAAADLATLRAAPRPEDIPPLEARVLQARADLERATSTYRRVAEAGESSAATAEEVTQRRLAMEWARAGLAAAEADLARTKAGTWGPQVDAARAEVARQDAAVQATQLRIDRLMVAAPSDGTVLKRYIEPGEYLSFVGSGPPAIVLGDLSTLHVRAQVDEEDTPMLHEGAEAVARIRGPVDERVALRMLRIEPLAIPKSQITGAATELVDTRVVEVVFEVVPPAPGAAPSVRLYPGEAVDVFISVDR
ncbi:MAG: biotin/lipoyl-binding protein [Phycisphaerales bacterium]|nr:biotin/lipoyl-binding protein [Phycisphaerales bacterium]